MHIIKTKTAAFSVTDIPMVTRLIMMCCAVLCLLSAPDRAFADQNTTPPSNNNGTLLAAFSPWEPFAFDGNDHAPQGIDLLLLQEVADRLGLKLELYPCPWRRCLRMLELGEIDVMTSFAYTEERAKFAQYVIPPYSRVTPVFYVNRLHPVPINQYDDLRNLTIGSVVDSRYFEPFDSDTSLEKFEAGSEILILKMLEAGRIDTIVGSDANADYQIRKNHMENIITKAPFRSGGHNDIHMVLSRKSSLMARYDSIVQIMRNLHKEGFIQKIHERYWPDFVPVDLPQLNEFPVSPSMSSE